jgi:hypothetical protein
MIKCSDACDDAEYYFLSVCTASEYAIVSGASIAADRKSMGQTVSERSCKDADFVCVSSI